MEGPSPDAASPVGSFFANARKKMERVAENFDAQASKLLGPRKPARSCVPPEVYASFVKKLTHPDNALILEAMRVFVATFSGSEEPSGFPQVIRGFCASLRVRMYALELWQPFAKVPMPVGLSDALSECIERWVTMELYSILFAADAASIEHDKRLFDRISGLSFLTPTLLEVPRKYWRVEAWKRSSEELFRLAKCRSPLDKLDAIRHACQILLDSLCACDGPEGGAGADVFLPALTLVLAYTNPPQLHSSLDFIRNYHNKAYKGSQMEYFLVSLETAVAFVEKMQASDLADMTQDAFDDLMARSLAGHVPPSWEALEKHEWVVLDPQTEATGGDEVEAARARVVGLSCIGCQDEELLIVALRRSFVREGLVIQWSDLSGPSFKPVVDAAVAAGLVVILVSALPNVTWTCDLVVVAAPSASTVKVAMDLRTGIAALEQHRKQTSAKASASQ